MGFGQKTPCISLDSSHVRKKSFKLGELVAKLLPKAQEKHCGRIVGYKKDYPGGEAQNYLGPMILN